MLRITIEPTQQVVLLDKPTAARLWTGKLDSGEMVWVLTIGVLCPPEETATFRKITEDLIDMGRVRLADLPKPTAEATFPRLHEPEGPPPEEDEWPKYKPGVSDK